MQLVDIIGSGPKPALSSADIDLLAMIRSRGGAISVRELMRHSRRYRSADVARAALNRLVIAGRGMFHDRKTRGRTAREFALWETLSRIHR
jgi:hypothetical protein